jgi:DNA-binding response OmpR family regulator
VWNAPYYGAEDNVMSLIRRIRKKIEPDPGKPIYILTVWGIGYRFSPYIGRKL